MTLHDKVVVFDTETDLASPSCAAPPMVCASFYDHMTGELVLLNRQDGLDRVERLLAEGYTLMGQNVSYDAGVCVTERPSLMRPFIEAYEDGRVICTLVTEKLAAIAEARSNVPMGLADLVKRYLKQELPDKKENYKDYPEIVQQELTRLHEMPIEDVRLEDFPVLVEHAHIIVWRKNFRLFYNDQDVSLWPRKAVNYVLEDARLPYFVARKQHDYPDRARQTKFDFALQLMAIRGVSVDEQAVKHLEKRLDDETKEGIAYLTEMGIYSASGSENTKLTKMLVAHSYASDGELPEIPEDKGRIFLDFLDMACIRLDEDGKATTSDEYRSFKQLGYLDTADLIRYGKAYAAGKACRYDDKMTDMQRKRMDGTLEAYAIWRTLRHHDIPRTEAGNIKTDKHTQLASGNEVLRMIAGLSADKKLLSTYVPLLEKGVKGGRICPYWNVLVNTGRSSCVAKGTKIEVLRDVSKYPDGIPIEDVREGDLVYTFDDAGALTLKKVLWAGKTGHEEVVRVCWRGQGNHHSGHVDLTPDHLVRLSDGEWKAAGKLVRGDSVCALHRGVSRGYARMWATGVGEIGRENAFVFECITGTVAEHVHHKNGNKLDNRIENLEGLTASYHTSLHSSNPSDEMREKRAEAMRARWRDNREQYLATCPRGENHRCWLGLTEEWVYEELWKHQGKPTKVCEEHGIDYATFQKHLEIHGIDFYGIARAFNARGEVVDDESWVRATRNTIEQHCLSSAEIRRLVGMSYYRWAGLQRKYGYDVPYNHKVTRVVRLKKTVDVYDLTVEDTANFMANEICVHNCGRPNMQNQPRKPGVRECFIAREGYVWLDVDYKTAELCSLAQVCIDWFGYSDMGDAIRAGRDLHLDFAAKMARISYDEAKQRLDAGDKMMKTLRQQAKAANFGYPGGMGAKTFVENDRKQPKPVGFTEDQARDLKYAWMDAYSEMDAYFKTNGKIVQEYGDYATYEQLYSGRLRGGVGYCDGCNTMFQGLTADGAKEALWLVTVDCYTNEKSPLWGSFPIIFVHDEIIVETPEEALRKGAMERLCDLMVQGMQKYTPDVPVGVDPAVIRRWRKDAQLILVDGIPVTHEDRPLTPEEQQKMDDLVNSSEYDRWWGSVELMVEPSRLPASKAPRVLQRFGRMTVAA